MSATTHPTFDNATFTLPVAGTTLVLRPVQLADAPNLRDRCADPLNVRFLPHLQGKENQTVAEVEAWIKTVQAGWNKDSLFLVIIDTADEGRVIGEGPLGYINWEKKECESGIMIDHQLAGRGIATQALNASMDFAFKELGLEKVKYGTMQENKGMVKVLSEKLRVKGRPEGRARKDGLEEFNFVFTREEWLAACK
ncbi:GNAT domain protein [Kalmanozyma brasiliensis GHG001]|uniref:N-acetyltransferase domain-containing protein n=1 Tax=Kalmanozyma brasiliensis (strain GHG001) TaxID=1365824 RepID=V5ESB0_KALBG|nr:GNAT domain protein [Kalmanozyma brasiliensis GHG001]EST04774.1 GNAT domain protein [Kalmanozyma brasiliensis GHG001]